MVPGASQSVYVAPVTGTGTQVAPDMQLFVSLHGIVQTRSCAIVPPPRHSPPFVHVVFAAAQYGWQTPTMQVKPFAQSVFTEQSSPWVDVPAETQAAEVPMSHFWPAEHPH
jgi:hypothetical protein